MHSDVNLYLNFAIYAIVGRMADADAILRKEPERIRSVARFLARELPIEDGQSLYRGMLLDPALPYTPDPRLTFVSWSEDRDVAAWFAERRSIISQPLAETNPRLRGFIAERTAPTSILFHHSWAIAFDGIAKFAQIHPLVGMDGARQISWSLRTQREVITEPLELDLKPTSDLSPAELWLLDRRFTPPWLHDEFLPTPPSASQGCVPEAT